MSDEDIEEFAYQAGHFFLIQFGTASASIDWLRKFADKVAAAEREAIIDIIEEYRISLPVLGELKADIRARGEK